MYVFLFSGYYCHCLVMMMIILLLQLPLLLLLLLLLMMMLLCKFIELVKCNLKEKKNRQTLMFSLFLDANTPIVSVTRQNTYNPGL